MTDPSHSEYRPRTGVDEREYFLKRAEDHRRLAAESTEPGAQSLHQRFEQLYRDRARAGRLGIFEPDAPAKIPGTPPPIDG